MLHKKHLIPLWPLLVALCLTACQRVIDVQVPDADAQLVIEGNITNVQGTQTVLLSRSVSYSATSTSSPVSGATVYFTDPTGLNYSLTEKSAGTYVINSFKGSTPNAYFLTVKTGGQTYNAASVMPYQVNLDSLSITGEWIGNDVTKTVWVNFVDPGNQPNFYRFILYVNGVQAKRVFVINDSHSDGRYIKYGLYQNDIKLNTGDKVEVEMQCIDEQMYNYWYALSSQGGTNPQNSATPANPVSNITGNVLGYFSAHTQQRKSVWVP